VRLLKHAAILRSVRDSSTVASQLAKRILGIVSVEYEWRGFDPAPAGVILLT